VSGQVIGGVIGAVIGSFIPGVGTQLGWMIGSAIGGYVDPTQVYGPRLKDVRGQTSAVGGAIPRAWGTAPVPGNIIWQQENPPVTEHKNTDDGKGSGTEQITYTYTRSYAVMFHLGEIAGVLQIKRNGKIVYDARDDDTLQAEYEASMGPLSSVEEWTNRLRLQRAMNNRWMNKCRIYTGTQTQEPDPTIEAYLGVGNVNAYRGRAYMVVTDDETQAGEIAQFEIVVASCGTVNTIPGGATWLLAFNQDGSAGQIKESLDGWDWSAAATSTPLEEGGVFSPTGGGFLAHANGQVLATSSSSSGVGGSVRFAFRDEEGSWHAITQETSSSAGLKPLWTGTHWMIAQNSGGNTQVSADGLTFTSTGYEFQSIAKVGGQVLGAYATGASFDIVSCRLLGSDGSDAVIKPPLHTGYITRRAVIDCDGSTVGLAVEEEFGAGDRRVHVLSSGDIAETWTEHTSPFPDFTGALEYGIKIHYANILNVWVVCARDRVAIGSSLSSLALEPTTFSDNITGIDSDGQKVIICGEGGMLFAWTPTDGWEALSGGEGTNIMDVVAFSMPGDAVAIPDSPGGYIGQDGTAYIPGSYTTLTPCATTTVGEIVADLCELSGLTADEYDVSQLTDTLDGYVVARETDAASVIESLRPVGMFDPAEWEGRIRFIKRGGTAVGSINGDDLVERDGDAVEREMVQEVELLQKVSVGYLDSQAAWAPNTQAWERTVGTINARGQSVVEVTAVMGADQAATTSKRKGLVSWGEPEKQKFSLLSLRHAKYTPTDILNLTHNDAEVDTIRLMQIEDDSGIREIESSLNCAEAYNATATGVAPKPPTITDASLRGPTYAVYMNLPSLRTQDNVPGVTIGACGMLTGWQGAAILLSEDGGVSYQQITSFNQPTAMGRLTAGCSDSSEPIAVRMNEGSLSSITEAQLALRHNAFAVVTNDVAELGQFQTATATDSNTYDLTGAVRGQLGTTAATHYVGDPFVMVAAAQFVPLDISLAGRTLYFKAVTFGTSQDAAEAVPFVFNPLFSSVTISPITVSGEQVTVDGQPIYVVT
jgi:hypothetical protein